jgi:hypothetical protein
VAQGFGQLVGERLIERHGQADVAEPVGLHRKTQDNGYRGRGGATAGALCRSAAWRSSCAYRRFPT